jgi:hypothetical protein
VPALWALKFVKNKDAIDVPRFYNTATGEESDDDPRLQDVPVPQGWRPLSGVERTRDDPVTVKWFENETTGQRINFDPRMTGERLVERGVAVQTFRLG